VVGRCAQQGIGAYGEYYGTLGFGILSLGLYL
jgi:hypothetical protein